MSRTFKDRPYRVRAKEALLKHQEKNAIHHVYPCPSANTWWRKSTVDKKISTMTFTQKQINSNFHINHLQQLEKKLNHEVNMKIEKKKIYNDFSSEEHSERIMQRTLFEVTYYTTSKVKNQYSSYCILDEEYDNVNDVGPDGKRSGCVVLTPVRSSCHCDCCIPDLKTNNRKVRENLSKIAKEYNRNFEINDDKV